MNLNETLRVIPELLCLVELANRAVWVLTRKINGKRLKEEHEAPIEKAIAFLERAKSGQAVFDDDYLPEGAVEDAQAYRVAVMACVDLELGIEIEVVFQQVEWALRGWDDGKELQLARDFFMSMSAMYSALLDEMLWESLDKRFGL